MFFSKLLSNCKSPLNPSVNSSILLWERSVCVCVRARVRVYACVCWVLSVGKLTWHYGSNFVFCKVWGPVWEGNNKFDKTDIKHDSCRGNVLQQLWSMLLTIGCGCQVWKAALMLHPWLKTDNKHHHFQLRKPKADIHHVWQFSSLNCCVRISKVW